jgi:uncharacterized membrane protein YdbT with pleckstrin-like domain
MATCPHCGATSKEDAPKFCASCGKPWTEAASPAGATPGGEGKEQILFEGRPSVVPSIGAAFVIFLTVGLAAIYFWLRSLGRHYRITTERVVIEEGVFSKRTEQLDLYRVTDYVVERPFGQRLLGTGNIVLEAMDRTTPKLHIDGIRTDVNMLYEKLRAATEKEKRRRGVRTVDVADEALHHH